MNRIYGDAAHVSVWLGLDAKETDAAFGLVSELDEVFKRHSPDDMSYDPDMLNLERHIRENHKALQALTAHGYVSTKTPTIRTPKAIKC